MTIWEELKNRKVLRVAAAYIVLSWLLIQIAQTFEETLELPGWFDKMTFAALVIGFPIAVLLSWAYDLRREPSSPEGKASSNRSAAAVVVVAMLISAIAAYFYLAPNDPEAVELATDETPSIAVLPFADLSPGGDQAWFADGISEEILNVLAKSEGMRVASRTASFRYRGEEVDIREIAQNLDVSLVLEGSVRAQANQLRITAQLINASDGFHLWSDTFNGSQDDVFAFQDEIAVSVAKELFGEIGIEALPEARFDGTRNVEAYNAYLRGLEKISDIGMETFGQAVPDFEEAIAIDPNYVDAWAGLVFAKRELRALNDLPPVVDEALTQALHLDPNNVMGLSALASYNAIKNRWLEAEQLYRRAIDIEPGTAQLHVDFGRFLRRTGRIERGLNEFLLARELGSEFADLTSLIVNTYAYLGRFAEARAVYEEEREKVGQSAMRGSEAYFVSLLADGLEAEARAFAPLIETPVASMRTTFFVDRLNGDPEASERLRAETLQRIETTGFPRYSDIENLVLAGEVELARRYQREVLFREWSIPSRLSIHVDDEIDPRYLPYRPNMLLLIDDHPEWLEAFKGIGTDLLALAHEKGVPTGLDN